MVIILPYSLWKVDVSEEIICKWQNHSFLSNIFTSRVLYQTLQTTKINFEKMLLANFQYPKSVLINLLQICSPEPSFVFVVLFIPSFMLWSFIFMFHSVWCWFLLVDFWRISWHSSFKAEAPGGVLPSSRLMGMCLWMGSHFQHRINWLLWGCLFIRVTKMGSYIFKILRVRNFKYVGI